MNITHIAVHLGGGAGTVLNNWFKNDKHNRHTFLLLNKTYYGERYENVLINLRGEYNIINKYVRDADVVIIHFWNHPYLFEFLTEANLPKCRLCIWSHVSGLYPPYVHTDNLISFADEFIYSTPISGKNFIWTTGGIEKYLNIRKSFNTEFRVGYVGTLDYSKLHPDFIDICEKISHKIPAKFIICGSGNDEERIRAEIKKRKLKKIFDFKGHVSDIENIMRTFDVFGYPLNEKHFGTCEQVLGEAMACGVMPIVLNNPSERFIVGDVGRVCNDINEYINNIVDIYLNPIENERYLKYRAIELYDINVMIDKWNNVFNRLIKQEKKEHQWKTKCNSGFEIFIESLGETGDKIKNYSNSEITKLFDSNVQWRSKSKGSIFQYLEAFPNDVKLQELSNL